MLHIVELPALEKVIAPDNRQELQRSAVGTKQQVSNYLYYRNAAGTKQESIYGLSYISKEKLLIEIINESTADLTERSKEIARLYSQQNRHTQVCCLLDLR